MNTKVDNLTMIEALSEMERLIQAPGVHYVVTPNVDHIVRLETDKELKAAYDHADLILTDGQPLIWISKLYRVPIKEKVSGSDLFPMLCQLAAKRGYKMYFLGAAEGVARRAAEILESKYEGLVVVGTCSPPMGFEKDTEKVDKIIEKITEVQPDILIVALGCPKQEVFIYQYRERMKVPLSLGLGASLDFVSGKVKRAPAWMSRHGLEWLFRILQDPQRLAKRYLIDDMKIVALAVKYFRKH